MTEQELRARIAELEPYFNAVRNAHNGYCAEMRTDMPDLREPGTPADAIRELIEEAEEIGRLAGKQENKLRIAELEYENASLLRLISDIRFALGDNGKRMPPELVEWCREMREDAERWRFAREHLAFSYSLHMDGTSNYDFNGRHLPRARSIDAAIDKARKGDGDEN